MKRKLISYLIYALLISCNKSNSKEVAKSEQILLQRIKLKANLKEIPAYSVSRPTTFLFGNSNSITFLKTDINLLLRKKNFLGIHCNSKFYMICSELSILEIDCDTIQNMETFRKIYLDYVLTKIYADNPRDFKENSEIITSSYFFLEPFYNPFSSSYTKKIKFYRSQKSINGFIANVKCRFLIDYFKNNSFRKERINLIIEHYNRVLIQYIEEGNHLYDLGRLGTYAIDSLLTPDNFVNIETYIINQ
jgi:hypothetical protein